MFISMMRKETKLLMNDFLEYCKDNQFDFPVYYHEIGMQIKAGKDAIGENSFDVTEMPDMGILKKNFPQYVCSPYAYKVFWMLNSIKRADHTLLDEFSRFFYEVNQVKRGGINTYKLSGWMVHVLYVFQLVTYNISNGIIPTSFQDKDVGKTFYKLQEYYSAMTDTSKALLWIFALIHDIGVVDGVQHHDRDGEKYVNEALLELGLDDSFWNLYGLSLSDATIVLQILVANHTLINKVSAEDSDRCIAEKCTLLCNKLEKVKNKIDYSDLATCFFILGIADLIAVDDSLYTMKKFSLAESSFKYLSSIFSNSRVDRNEDEIAFLRLGEMVYEHVYKDLKKDTCVILEKYGYDFESFCKGLFNIYRIEYATAFLKPLQNLEYTVVVLASLLDFLLSSYGIDEIGKASIVFDSAIDNEKLKRSLENNEFISTVKLLTKEDCKSLSDNLCIEYNKDRKQLVLSTL